MQIFAVDYIYCLLLAPVLASIYFFTNKLSDGNKKRSFLVLISILFIIYLFQLAQADWSSTGEVLRGYIGKYYDSHAVLFGLTKSPLSLFVILFGLLLAGMSQFVFSAEALSGVLVLLAGFIITSISATPFASVLGLSIQLLGAYLLYWKKNNDRSEENEISHNRFSQNGSFILMSSAGYLCFSAMNNSINWSVSSYANLTLFSHIGLGMFFLGLILLSRPLPLSPEFDHDDHHESKVKSGLLQIFMNISVWLTLYLFIKKYQFTSFYHSIGVILLAVSVVQYLYSKFQKSTAKELTSWLSAGFLFAYSFLFLDLIYASFIFIFMISIYYSVTDRLMFLLKNTDSKSNAARQNGKKVTALLYVYCVTGAGFLGFSSQAVFMGALGGLDFSQNIAILTITGFIIAFSSFWRIIFSLLKKQFFSAVSNLEIAFYIIMLILCFGFIWTNHLGIGLEPEHKISFFGRSLVSSVLGSRYNDFSVNFNDTLVYIYFSVLLFTPLFEFLLRKIVNWAHRKAPQFSQFILQRFYFDSAIENMTASLSVFVSHFDQMKWPQLIRASYVEKMGALLDKVDVRWTQFCQRMVYQPVRTVFLVFNEVYGGNFRRQLVFIMFTLFILLVYFLVKDLM